MQETRTDGSDQEFKKWSKIFNTNQIFLTGYGSNSVGAGIVIRSSDVFKVDQVIKDPLGRYVAVLGDHEDGRFLVASFYCPSQDKEIRQFIDNEVYKLVSSLEDNNELPQFTILAGDTNTTFTAKDKEGGSNRQKQGAINSLLGLQDRFNLQDIFRVKHPELRKYSWECINPSIIKERIDIIYTSQNLQDY